MIILGSFFVAGGEGRGGDKNSDFPIPIFTVKYDRFTLSCSGMDQRGPGPTPPLLSSWWGGGTKIILNE